MRIRRLLLLIIIVGIALRVLNLVTAPPIELDGIEYTKVAKLFAAGDFQTGIKSLRVPFYPIVVAGFYFLVGDVELAGRLASLFFGLLLIPFCYLFTKRFFDEEKALLITAGIAIHPYLARYSVLVLSESLATFLFAVSIFCFYRGWVEKRTGPLVCSGTLLTLAYLTRPEYLVYFIPLVGILIIANRRYLHAGAFIASFLWLAAVFLIFIRLDTGFWVIDRRMLLWQQTAAATSSFHYIVGVISPLNALRNLPAVVSHFCEAIYIPFLFLACFGFAKTRKPYKTLLLVLVATHVLCRSFVPHSTERYSVEFAPLVMIFVGEGVHVAAAFLARYRQGKSTTTALFSVVVLTALFVGIGPGEPRREMEKKAGLLLRSNNARIVAARSPRSAFYAQADWVDLVGLAETSRSCEKLAEGLRAQKVEYVVSDRGMERDTPLVHDCLSRKVPMADLADDENQFRIYKFAQATSDP